MQEPCRPWTFGLLGHITRLLFIIAFEVGEEVEAQGWYKLVIFSVRLLSFACTFLCLFVLNLALGLESNRKKKVTVQFKFLISFATDIRLQLRFGT